MAMQTNVNGAGIQASDDDEDPPGSAGPKGAKMRKLVSDSDYESDDSTKPSATTGDHSLQPVAPLTDEVADA
ncbi:hypothetical protein M407DRAFT_32850 [Tulasnella calospora MUT 4182]|uniref:Uncharacterized protein n=1 Tax=Tulasnella calospora MUT 4182 TaxID=1051891 RepID=A0A0C3K7U4_9AGAM|nr:hypothetical protein M407DRAFT_32850 [Tulasnella calospora MUT 4182]